MQRAVLFSVLMSGCVSLMTGLSTPALGSVESLVKGIREPAAITGGRRSIGDSMMGPSTSESASEAARRPIYRDLLSADSPQLSFPAYPRIWMDRTKSEYVSSNTSLGFQVPILSSGAKLAINYKYNLKTTLVIMSSMRRFNGSSAAGAASNSIQPATKEMEATILRWDERTNQAFPDVKSDYPMVGFCSFEASLTNETFKQIAFEVLGNGQAFEIGNVETAAQTVFSNFFQVRPDISVRAYLEDVCGKLFRQNVERSVITDFSKVILERLIHDNPAAQCEPPAGNSRDTLAVDLGDASCLEWHANQEPAVRKLTIPRCEMDYRGAYRCVAKARANTACTLYQDKRTDRITEHAFGRESIRLTDDAWAFQCDKNLGLKCEMTRNPWMVLGQPFFMGKAICR